MRSQIYIIALAGSTLCCSTLFAQNVIVDSPATTIVESKTQTWSSQRELLVMFNNAPNRILLADIIVNTSLTSGDLTPTQKYDGLRIAGTAYFTDKEYAKAASALEHAASHTLLSHEKAEVLAAAAESYFLNGNIAQSINCYKLSADKYEVSDPSLIHRLHVESTYRRLVHIAEGQNENTIVLQYALKAIVLSQNLTEKTLDEAFYRYSAANASQKLGDGETAVQLFEDLLALHPDYMNNQPNLGLIPHAKIQKHLSNGSSWEKPDKDLIGTVLEISRNPDYRLMPAAVNYAEKLAAAWDKIYKYDASIALRSEVAKNTLSTLDSLDSNNAADLQIGKQLWRQMAISQFNGATVSYYSKKDFSTAEIFLDRIVEPNNFSEQRLVDDAHRLLTKVIETSSP